MIKVNTFWFNYLRPTYFFESIKDINLEKLYQEGVRTIISDLDNTLTPHFSNHALKSTIEFVLEVKRLGMKIFIFSNNRSKRVNSFIKNIEKFCKLDGYISNAKKPFIWKTKKMLKKYNININDSIIIGDQFITDILVANRLQIKSILVTPIFDVTIGNSNFIQRILEKYLYKNLRQNILTTEQKRDKSELL